MQANAMKYVRVKVKTERGVRSMWGKNFQSQGAFFTFQKCKPDGDQWYGSGSKLILVSGRGDDLLEVKPASIDRVFGELRVQSNAT
jgi:hypothetical protein